MRRYLEAYGHHSDRELDVSYPDHREDPRPVYRQLKLLLPLGDEEGPERESPAQVAAYEATRRELLANVSFWRRRKLMRTLEQMRDMLWWREELRDLSTKTYHLIRQYTLRLAALLVAEGVLDAPESIWMLKLRELWAFLEGGLDAQQLQAIEAHHRRYYDSFRHYQPENEIGPAFSEGQATPVEGGLQGLGCSRGRVTGVARVIAGLEDIERIRPGDILVTKFTDTGWTPKFAILSGVVTEYGGLLCHAAIVSREYGLPCIVAAHDITKLIRDGQTITIDGATGVIAIEGDET